MLFYAYLLALLSGQAVKIKVNDTFGSTLDMYIKAGKIK